MTPVDPLDVMRLETLHRVGPALNGRHPNGKPRPTSTRFESINAMVDLHLAKLNGTEAKVYIVLWRVERKGIADISHQQLASLCGVDRRSVIRAIAKLREAGLIQIAMKGNARENSSNQYRIAEKPSDTSVTRPSDKNIPNLVTPVSHTS